LKTSDKSTPRTDSGESKPSIVVYEKELKLCLLFNTEDHCSVCYLQRRVGEQIIYRKLPINIIGREWMLPLPLMRMTTRIV
jgi:hypothetical protein